MKHLIIKNVGPIKEIDIILKRFNFLIGPQSSGKSTIAKILSTCEWIEKEIATTRNENAIGNGDSFKSLVESFHKMEDYFDSYAPSYVFFETDFVVVVYENKELKIILKRESDYHRQKICYIPSDRNMVTLPELKGFEFGMTNLRSFLFDWYRAREFYTPQNKTSLLGLDVKYYYNEKLTTKNDRIQHVNGNTYDISLSNSSSGLQSLTPLIVMLQYYSGQYFNEYDFKNSFEQDSRAKQTRSALVREVAMPLYNPNFKEEEIEKLVKQFNDELHKGVTRVVQIFELYDKACNRLLIPNRTTFIIEEPEQNLYPFTQIDLLEAIVKLCTEEKEHGCTITTHSPFILNYLNVLIKRYYKSVPEKVALNPEDLSVFATLDGRLVDLIQTNSETAEKSVNAEDLVEAMRVMYSEYRQMKES
jgi:energy-coupling factor transporter ATP-binding protein EcfA2